MSVGYTCPLQHSHNTHYISLLSLKSVSSFKTINSSFTECQIEISAGFSKVVRVRVSVIATIWIKVMGLGLESVYTHG